MRHTDLVSGKLVVYWLMDLDTISQSSQILQGKENSIFVYSSPSCTETSLPRKKIIYQHLSALDTFVPSGHERAVFLAH